MTVSQTVHPLPYHSHSVASLEGAMSSSTSVVLIIIAATVGAWIWRRLYLSSKMRTGTLPLPPGPTPLPIIGNFFDIPTSYPWLKVNGWSKIYGTFSPLTDPLIHRWIYYINHRGYHSRPHFGHAYRIFE